MYPLCYAVYTQVTQTFVIILAISKAYHGACATLYCGYVSSLQLDNTE